VSGFPDLISWSLYGDSWVDMNSYMLLFIDSDLSFTGDKISGVARLEWACMQGFQKGPSSQHRVRLWCIQAIRYSRNFWLGLKFIIQAKVKICSLISDETNYATTALQTCIGLYTIEEKCKFLINIIKM